MRSRVHIVAVVVLAVLLMAAAGFALFALPFLVIVALLATGRYIGEELILASRGGTVPRPRRAVARRWHPVRPGRVRSLFARAPRTFRGPPAFAAVV